MSGSNERWLVMNPKEMSILFSEQSIRERVKALAREMNEHFRGRKPVFVGVLKGSFIFLGDLVRELDLDLEVDFVALSSYGAATETSGEVRLEADLRGSIGGRDVIVVEDIVDTGLTLSYLVRLLRDRHPSSLSVVCLLDKPERRQVKFEPDYRGFIIPDLFVVGYGLDCSERYRHLRDIRIFEPL